MRRPGDRRAARLKYGSILGGLVLGALVLLAWSQTWFELTLAGDAAERVAVRGQVAAPALSALALAGLALAAALSIAGPVFRVILGALETALGACVALSAGVALADPVLAGARSITDATGVDGEASITALVAGQSAGPWPVVALVLGILMAILGLAIVLTSRGWPDGSRRYSPVHFEAADAEQAATDAGGDSVTDWDSLSEGQDPTAPPGRSDQA